MYTIERLNALAALQYGHMTYPQYKRQLRLVNRPGRPTLIAVGARHGDTPAGLVLAGFHSKTEAAFLLSVFTAESHQRKGVARRMMECMEDELRAQGVKTVKAVYEEGKDNAHIIESLLSLYGFSNPVPRMRMIRSTVSRITEMTWLKKDYLPASCELFPWQALTLSEKDAILASREQNPWFPETLSPFRGPSRYEPINSLGLRRKGEVIGWLINHRTRRDTIRYTTMFVREDLQARGLGIPMMMEGLRRQIAHGDSIPRITFAIHLQNTPRMEHLISRRLKPFADITTTIEVTRQLG